MFLGSAAAADFAHLRHRLEAFSLAEIPVAGDGHCQFRSLSYQVCSPAKRMIAASFSSD